MLLLEVLDLHRVDSSLLLEAGQLCPVLQLHLFLLELRLLKLQLLLKPLLPGLLFLLPEQPLGFRLLGFRCRLPDCCLIRLGWQLLLAGLRLELGLGIRGQEHLVNSCSSDAQRHQRLIHLIVLVGGPSQGGLISGGIE